MKTNLIAAAGFSIATILAGQALADPGPPTPKTTEQIQSELAEARRTGEIVADESGKKMNELYPDRYPSKRVTQSNTQLSAEGPPGGATRTINFTTGD